MAFANLRRRDRVARTRKRHHDVKKHLLFLLLTILRKRLKLLLLGLLSSAFASSNHCDISLLVDVGKQRKERGKEGKGKQEQGNRGKQGWERGRQAAGESGGSYEDVLASGARFGSCAGAGERELGPGALGVLRFGSRVGGLVCYWLVCDIVPMWLARCCLFAISRCSCFLMIVNKIAKHATGRPVELMLGDARFEHHEQLSW
jgi:hypothetical protein